MTFYHGLGMFIFNMVALLVGAIITYIIINKVEKYKKRKELLKQVLETDIHKSTLYDVYNALTNYSSHNKRAIRIGKKGSEGYRIDNSSMDSVKSNEARDSEIERYVSSDHFVFFYHKALSNLGRNISLHFIMD